MITKPPRAKSTPVWKFICIILVLVGAYFVYGMQVKRYTGTDMMLQQLRITAGMSMKDFRRVKRRYKSLPEQHTAMLKMLEYHQDHCETLLKTQQKENKQLKEKVTSGRGEIKALKDTIKSDLQKLSESAD